MDPLDPTQSNYNFIRNEKQTKQIKAKKLFNISNPDSLKCVKFIKNSRFAICKTYKNNLFFYNRNDKSSTFDVPVELQSIINDFYSVPSVITDDQVFLDILKDLNLNKFSSFNLSADYINKHPNASLFSIESQKRIFDLYLSQLQDTNSTDAGFQSLLNQVTFRSTWFQFQRRFKSNFYFKSQENAEILFNERLMLEKKKEKDARGL